MSVQIRGILGALFLFIAVGLAAWIAVATFGLMTFDFAMEKSIAAILVQFLPILSGLASIAFLSGLGLYLAGKPEMSWKAGTLGFLLVLPTALFIGIFGMIGAAQMLALFGAEVGADPRLGQLVPALLLGVPGGALGASLFGGLGAFLISASVVRESEETFDRNPTRGMNIMDPNVQKELEEARRKHQEDQDQ